MESTADIAISIDTPSNCTMTAFRSDVKLLALTKSRSDPTITSKSVQVGPKAEVLTAFPSNANPSRPSAMKKSLAPITRNAFAAVRYPTGRMIEPSGMVEDG
ncbi:hypothetical protein D9M68_770130 [compost metagenome]